MQVTDSNPTLDMDRNTSGPETLFSAPERSACRSLIRSLATGAATVTLLFWASGQIAQAAGLSVRFVRIPREVLEKKAVEQGDIKFFELAALSVEMESRRRSVKIRRIDRAVMGPARVHV